MTSQKQIIAELGVLPRINPELEISKRVTFLAEYLARTGLKGFVLGISGGQDSLLAGLLAQRAVEARRAAGAVAEFHAVLLPYGQQTDRADAELACEIIQPDHMHDIDIRPTVDAFASSFKQAEGEALADFHRGNVKARVRMITQYALAGTFGLCVVGTDHAAEAVTGFFTKFGDGGADILPLSGLSKRQGRQLLQHLAVPEVFLTKQPTADLLDTNPGRADEDELALSYETIDDYLEGEPVASGTTEAIEARFEATRHKRALPVAFTDQS